jgi:hypothetical protein
MEGVGSVDFIWRRERSNQIGNVCVGMILQSGWIP